MGLTINHDTRRLQSIPPDELGRYIDGCMTKAYAEARNSYREELQRVLLDQANQMHERERFILPLPAPVQICVGEHPFSLTAERVERAEFTRDQIRAIAYFLTGVRP